MATGKKCNFLVCQKVTMIEQPLFDDAIIEEAKRGDFWFVKDLTVRPAKMWAIQHGGHSHSRPWIVPGFIAKTRKEAIAALMKTLSPRITWENMKERGFSVVRVSVEVA